MIRYVVSYPVEANVRAEQMQMVMEMMKENADARDWRDIVLNQGGTIRDMRRSPSVSSLVRRARSKVR
jgi:hypothetical protein